MQLVYGPKPEDWTVETTFETLSLWSCNVYRRRPPPGAFFEESRVPITIVWLPTDSERDEGPWTLVETKKRFTKDRDLSDLPFYSNESFHNLMNTTQDDSSVIMLMQHRAPRRSWFPSRSRSQPPHLRRRKFAFSGVPRSDGHWWLTYHLCPLDSTWRFGGAGDDVCEPQEGHRDDDLCYPFSARSCVQGRTHICHCVQQTSRWQRRSFLSCVARCQDGMTSQVGMKSAEHRDDCPCPQLCGSIRLSRLNVPEDLRFHHPRRELRRNAGEPVRNNY